MYLGLSTIKLTLTKRFYQVEERKIPEGEQAQTLQIQSAPIFHQAAHGSFWEATQNTAGW